MKLNLKSDLKFHRFAIYFFFQPNLDLNLYHEYRLDIISQVNTEKLWNLKKI